MKISLSDILAVLGAIVVVCGIAMLSKPFSVIALGVFLICGAVATMKVEKNAKKVNQ